MKSRVNYEIIKEQRTRTVVRVNRLKRAYHPVDWQEPKKGKGG